MTVRYLSTGVCARPTETDIGDGRIVDVRVTGSCGGNLQGSSGLFAGTEADGAIRRMQGIRCGSEDRSCPGRPARSLSRCRQRHG